MVFFSTLSSALTGNSFSSSSIFYCRGDWRGIDEKREREREREKKKAAGDGKGCSQREDNFLTTMIPVYMYPQKKEKPTRYWRQHTQLDQSKSNREREKVGRGGCTVVYKSLCTYKFPPDEIQIDPRRTWADIINCTTRGL